jgi:hypothetical protein
MALPMDTDWTPIFKDQYEAIEKLIEIVSRADRYFMFIRIHPNEGKKRNHLGIEGKKSLEIYNGIYNRVKDFKNIELIWPDDEVNSHSLAEAADVAVVWASTIGLEVAARGKPVITLDNPIYRTTGFCWVPIGKDHLEAILDEAVSTSEEERENRKEIALNWLYHEHIRISMPFPMIMDHGRMERVSTCFSDPEELSREKWPSLTPILEFLTNDTPLY